jgi:hypothetical protein
MAERYAIQKGDSFEVKPTDVGTRQTYKTKSIMGSSRILLLSCHKYHNSMQ